MSFEQNMSPERKKSNAFNFESLEKEKNFVFFKELREKFPKAEVYLVGGAVRDLFLNRPTKDYDFVVRKVKAKDLEEFLADKGTVNLVGQTFGVFKFIPRGELGASSSEAREMTKGAEIDIALPRKDFSLGTGGYRDVEIQSEPDLNIEQDLGRRDFTINAMAVKLFNGARPKIVDPFKGRKDLKNKVIRAVGSPNDRFKEDYSRMLRALRFACQFDFDIEDKTWKAIKNKIKGLNEISRKLELASRGRVAEPEIIERRVVPYEIIAKEFLKSFYADPVQAFDLYDQSGAFEQIMPEILKMKACPQPEQFHTEGDVWEHTRLVLEKLYSNEFKQHFKDEPHSKELVIAALFHDIGKPPTLQTPEKHGVDRIRADEHDKVGAKIVKKICTRLKLSSPAEAGIDTEKVIWLVQHHQLLAHGKGVKLRPRTIERYFFNPQNPGKDHLKLSFADISATIPPSGRPDFRQYNAVLDQIKEFKKLSPSKKELPQSLLNGDEIMKEFNLKPGRKIGKLKRLVREEQLQQRIKTKDQAIKFLKKHI